MLRLARPEADRRGARRLVGAVLAVIGLTVVVWSSVLAPEAWLPNLIGRSGMFCLKTIPTLALPTLICVLILEREGASTQST